MTRLLACVLLGASLAVFGIVLALRIQHAVVTTECAFSRHVIGDGSAQIFEELECHGGVRVLIPTSLVAPFEGLDERAA